MIDGFAVSGASPRSALQARLRPRETRLQLGCERRFARPLCRSTAAAGREPGCPAQGGEKPHWGPHARELLVWRLDRDVSVPAKNTVHAVLDRYGLDLVSLAAAPPRPRHTVVRGCRPQPFVACRVQAGHASHFLLLCEALE